MFNRGSACCETRTHRSVDQVDPVDEVDMGKRSRTICFNPITPL